MKQAILALLLIITPLCLSANESVSEFKYIQPIAVEKASIKKIVVKPKEVIEEAVVPKVQETINPASQEELNQDGYGLERGRELDSDSDGVVDSKDQCPDTSIEFSVDGYGCPQAMTLKINFATNSYEISEQLINDLKEFALFLQDNIGYQVIIYGYTDNSGKDDEKNKEISQKRANSIKEVLIRYGIKEIRLTAIGKGSNDPIADNSTKEGRAANRRIEIELLR